MAQNSQQTSSKIAYNYGLASIPIIYLSVVMGVNNGFLLGTPFNADMAGWFCKDTMILQATGTRSVLKHSHHQQFLMNPKSLNIRLPTQTLQQHTMINRQHFEAM